jgi:PAS domain S-box-containing protein
MEGKQAQAARPEGQLDRILELVTKQMAVAVTHCSRDMRYLWANQEYANWLQLPLDKIVGHPIADVLGKEAFNALRHHFERVLTGEKVDYEQETTFRGIGQRWTSATYTPTFDNNRVANGWVAVVVDITERKRAEAALHEAEERFRLAMNNVASGLYTLDLQGLVTYVNPAAETIFGWTNAELLGKKMHDVTHYKHPDGTPFPASECPGLQVLQKGAELREHEDMFIRKDGSFFPVVYSASPLKEHARTVGIVVGFRDDTQRREAERIVRECEERFRLVANAAPVMIWMSGVDKLCTYFNQRWLEFTGRSLKEELGNGWSEGVHPKDLASCLRTYEQAFDRRDAFQMHYRLRRHDGEYRWIFDQGVPRFNADGSFAGYIGSCTDLTERKLVEEAWASMSRKLLEAQEQERTRIARELHDDVNQRLGILSVEIDRMKEAAPATYGELRSRMDELGKRTSEISDTVQSLSHELHSSKLEYLGLVSAMRGFCKEFSDKHKVEIDFSSEGMPSTVPPDVSLCLFRVMQEGLQNALKHSGVRFFEVKLHGSSTDIQLTVRDSGVGFDPELIKDTQGLGLISMQERVRLVKGAIMITSRPQSGTEIDVRVPLSAGEQTERAKLAGA